MVYVTADLENIKKDYMNGLKYQEIQEKNNITYNQLIYLIQKYKWKRKSNRSKVQKGNKNAKGNRGGAAPKNNKNAVVTGEYETIYSQYLSEEEENIWKQVKVNNKKKTLEEQYKLLVIRERRMLGRIKKLSDRNSDLTINSIRKKKKQGASFDDDEETSTTTAQYTDDKIQRIEESLTKIQEAKRRIIDSIQKIDMEEKKFEFQKDIYEASSKNNKKETTDKIQEYFDKLEGVFRNEHS